MPSLSLALLGGGQLMAIFFTSPIALGIVVCHFVSQTTLGGDSCLPSFSRALLGWGQLFAIYFSGPT